MMALEINFRRKKEMNKRGVGFIGIVILLLIILAGASWLYAKGYSPEFLNKKTTEENQTQDEEILQCQTCDFPEIEKAAVYFDDGTNQGMNHFIENSNSMLYCGFRGLEDKSFASRLIALQNAGKDVKVYFGIDETMRDCDVVCVPKLQSQYTYLLGEGVPVSFGRSDFNFCINEKAVYIFSNEPGTITPQSQGIILFSPAIREKYLNYFTEIFD
jgi:hypothetical protein